MDGLAASAAAAATGQCCARSSAPYAPGMGDGAGAKALFVQGIEAYGAPEAERLGVLAQLRELAAEKSTPAAVEILRGHWPE